jgi:hypothetical protein
MTSYLSESQHQVNDDVIGEPAPPRRAYGHAHVIYAIGTDESGPIKIGQSADVAQRIFSLQTGNPLPLAVYGVRLIIPKIIPAGPRFNTLKHAKESAARLEKYIHFELSQMRLRLMGEWFDLSAAEALEVIEKSADNVRCRAISFGWLSDPASRLDPEIGWMRENLASIMADTQAQAGRANQMGLTAMRKTGNI